MHLLASPHREHPRNGSEPNLAFLKPPPVGGVGGGGAGQSLQRVGGEQSGFAEDAAG